MPPESYYSCDVVPRSEPRSELALRFIPAASSPLPPREIAPRALPLERVLSGVVRTVELARIVHTIVISDAKQGTTASHSTLITGLSISD